MPATIIIDLDPVLITAGSVAVRWYGLMMSVAIVAGVALAIRDASDRGFREDDVVTVAVWAIPSAFIGARLFHVVDAWSYYGNYPLQILAIQEGGLAIYGGLIAGGVVGAVVAHRKGMLTWRLLDAAAPGMILGQAIGRVGCAINGDHQGPPTDLPWATSYIHAGSLAPDSLPRHPAQIYEMLYDLAVLGLLLALRPRLKPDGVLFCLYVGLYSFGRFWISALREDAPFLLGLKEAQAISVVAFLVAVPMMVLLGRRQQVAGHE